MQGTYGNGRLVTVFGGSGFVGRHIVRALAIRGYRVRAAVRRPDLAGHLQPLGMVGQIQAVQANLRYPASVHAAAAGAVAVVNAVGILAERGKQSFQAVHVDGAAAVAAAAHTHGITSIVHLSALGADADSDSRYFASKAEGEAAVAAHGPAIVLQPSVQFGPGDSFFTRFAAMARVAPALPLVGPNTRFQPVYVGDVAEAAARAVDGLVTAATYELGGPEVLTFRECLQRMLAVVERWRPLPTLPRPFALAAGWVFQHLPGQILTVDQVRQLQHDVIVSDVAEADGRTLAGLGISPTTLAAILPSYLSRFRRHGEFERSRHAG